LVPAFAAALEAEAAAGGEASDDERADAEAEVDLEDDWGDDDEAPPTAAVRRPAQAPSGRDESAARPISLPVPPQASPEGRSTARPTSADRVGFNTTRFPGNSAASCCILDVVVSLRSSTTQLPSELYLTLISFCSYYFLSRTL
jgi:hypothetical protein